MKPADRLYCCTFTDLSEDKDLLPELLGALEYHFSSHHQAEKGIYSHTLYFEKPEEAEQARLRLEQCRADWKELGAKFGEILRTELPKENWAESWKIHFTPIEISDTLAVTPSWIQLPEKPGRHVIVLDPGMSFGTGRHATTKFCLGAIDSFARNNHVAEMSFLDAGCGSGILAIAASKFGFKRVDGFDIDPDAVEVAEKNAEDNHTGKIGFSAAPLIEYDNEEVLYDAVAANILSSALLAGRDKLLSFLKPGGTLILAGIMVQEYPVVRNAFEEAGCRELRSMEDGDWKSGIFLFRP